VQNKPQKPPEWSEEEYREALEEQQAWKRHRERLMKRAGVGPHSKVTKCPPAIPPWPPKPVSGHAKTFYHTHQGVRRSQHRHPDDL
jgi:hypothetical protein